MKFNAANHEEYINSISSVSKKIEESLEKCKNLQKDLFVNEDAEKAIEYIEKLYEVTKKRSGMSEAQILNLDKSYLYEFNTYFINDYNKFIRMDRVVRKEHEKNAETDTNKMLSLLDSIKKINVKAKDYWIPEISKELQLKNFKTAGDLFVQSPLYRGGVNSTKDSYPSESSIELICKNITGCQKVWDEYVEIKAQGKDFLRSIPNQIRFKCNIEMEKNNLEINKANFINSLKKLINELNEERNNDKWLSTAERDIKKILTNELRTCENSLFDINYYKDLLSSHEKS